MKPYVYAISDIHGEYELFKQVISYFDPTLHQLVLMGDLNDRGAHTKESFLLGMKLVKEFDAIYLRGNHEEYFLEFLVSPEDWYPMYLRNGGKETIESLLHKGATEEYSPTEISMMIRSRYKELVDFLVERPLYYEWQQYVFVHAGVDLSKKDWHETSPRDFLWIREPFHQGKNKTGKTIVFGHTITPMLHGDMQTTDLWLSDNKIGIDGGAVFGGSVHGVIFDENGIVQDIEYQNLNGPWQPDR
ncbi:metallophosphoesterase [Enterococcus phoeniculicola]|jgi:serine/threonine protein phosphatase 1|uniref:Serine/threonine protein phosphatase 1 n=1 Tax=Enterococcus phoeniculicola ATCC BAA-412 TaxID=1158610 RepID=R3WW89_9ENTE|nr:metallophosphoesterase [Enterococcus phoeniculicola]EOL46035.1 serine/threonine protein phosphatase 1 [Enterococcus phoeniculicola ATCC BAA-412]EOT77120.1 serine/threonine protein phosphatase 1 [Enterococcus phoeniculicola ATCC BAA-412]